MALCIFHDRNKRTGLLCAFFYLYTNQHYLAIPIDAVGFTQKIAATKSLEQDDIDKLIDEIETWLKKYTAKDSPGDHLQLKFLNIICFQH